MGCCGCLYWEKRVKKCYKVCLFYDICVQFMHESGDIWVTFIDKVVMKSGLNVVIVVKINVKFVQNLLKI